MRSVSIRLFLAPLPLAAFLSVAAQDTRTVTEPRIPPACVTLDADIVSTHGNIPVVTSKPLRPRGTGP